MDARYQDCSRFLLCQLCTQALLQPVWSILTIADAFEPNATARLIQA
jgi:hypothetical protein